MANSQHSKALEVTKTSDNEEENYSPEIMSSTNWTGPDRPDRPDRLDRSDRGGPDNSGPERNTRNTENVRQGKED